MITELIAKDSDGNVVLTIKRCTLPNPGPTDHIWDMFSPWMEAEPLEMEATTLAEAFIEALRIEEEE